jgi:serine/threonine protein kinase
MLKTKKVGTLLIFFFKYYFSFLNRIYTAPEILNDAEKYSFECDVWSIGVVIYEVYCLFYNKLLYILYFILLFLLFIIIYYYLLF